MDISTDSDRRIDSLHIAFLNQNLPSFGTKMLNFLLWDDLSFSKQLYLFV